MPEQTKISGTIGAFGGMPIIESPFLPRGRMFQIVDMLYVSSMWFDIQFPLAVADVRRACRADLAALVRAAERRLFGVVSDA